MANIITTVGAVGGTGRTTVTVNLATVLAYIYRLRVLCINLDHPSSFSLWFEQEKQPPSSSRPLVDYPINLHDIKEQTRLIAAALYIVSDWDGKEHFFNESLNLVRDEYDYILIDTERSFNMATLRACAVADLVIISGGLNINEAHHLGNLVQKVKQTQAYFQRSSQHVRSVLNYRVEPDEEELRHELSPAQIEEMKGYYVKAYTQTSLPPLFKTEIRADAAYEQAVCNCQPVISDQPDSETVNDYVSLAGDILSMFRR